MARIETSLFFFSVLYYFHITMENTRNYFFAQKEIWLLQIELSLEREARCVTQLRPHLAWFQNIKFSFWSISTQCITLFMWLNQKGRNITKKCAVIKTTNCFLFIQIDKEHWRSWNWLRNCRHKYTPPYISSRSCLTLDLIFPIGMNISEVKYEVDPCLMQVQTKERMQICTE